jgi:hypothetical protein
MDPGSNKISERLRQESKHDAARISTEEGMQINFREEQYENALTPI